MSLLDPMTYGDTGPLTLEPAEEVLTETVTDALLFGMSAALVVTAVVMAVFLIGTIVTAVRGNIPVTILFAFALLTTVNPILGLVGAIIALIVFAVRGDVHNGIFAIGGCGLGWIVSLIATAIIGAMMLA